MLERMKNVLRNRKEEGDRGFSLVELAVVIAIIAILVAIAVPVFMSMNSAATNAANRANAANGSSMVAAAIANSSSGFIALGTKGTPDVAPAVTAYGVLAQLKDNGTAVDATIAPPASGNVTLSNYCITVGGATSGPAC